jgi:hypothetical protein
MTGASASSGNKQLVSSFLLVPPRNSLPLLFIFWKIHPEVRVLGLSTFSSIQRHLLPPANKKEDEATGFTLFSLPLLLKPCL